MTPQWGIFRTSGPAGLIHSTARDLLAFARLHLDGGSTPDGTRVLSARSAAAMQEPQVAVPDPYTLGSHWGLGWILMSWDGRRVFGHDGGTLGQAAFLRILPEARPDGGAVHQRRQARPCRDAAPPGAQPGSRAGRCVALHR